MNCRACNAPLPRNRFKCPSCLSWNSGASDGTIGDGTILVEDVPDQERVRYLTGPWDHAFGGGIALGSVILLAGEPGAGKSTLSLQIASILGNAIAREVLYIVAEENLKQVKASISRLRLKTNRKLRLMSAMEAGSQVNFHEVIEKYNPCATFIDSLSGLTKDLKDQIAICKTLKVTASTRDIPVIIVDHVNKANDFAGLMDLQHEVDTTSTLIVLEENGEEVRLLESRKNRFGPTPNSVLFTMTQYGLVPRKLSNSPED